MISPNWGGRRLRADTYILQAVRRASSEFISDCLAMLAIPARDHALRSE